GARGLQMQPHWPPEPKRNFFGQVLERAKGFEPSTPTLARSCSTPELHPRFQPLARRYSTGDRQSKLQARSSSSPKEGFQRVFAPKQGAQIHCALVSSDRSAVPPARTAVAQPIGGSHCRSRDCRPG